MGADAFADENGEFVVEIRAWRVDGRAYTPEYKLMWDNLEPGQKIDIEILKGEWR